jgi:hypothetical protein
MGIDRRAEWWKGEEFRDIADYLREYTANGLPVRIVLQSTCGCRHTVFQLEADPEEGCARRTCSGCGSAAFIADSGEPWDEAEPFLIRCPCGNDRFEIGVGFSFTDDDEVRWVTVGMRCVRCGILGSPVDWEINYAPTEHLLEQT